MLCRIARQSEDLDSPEVVAVGINEVTNLLDARSIELDHAQACIIVRQVSQVSLNINRNLMDGQIPKASSEVRIEPFGDCIGIKLL